ncbi:MAG: DUF1540 domain-containing protein [Clostridia bacterium]|nr:DUF1540 domain-containing protein [Clostridia bacterium]
MSRRPAEIKNIKCDAQNCVYNSAEDKKCMAGEIKVGTPHASTSAETICSTFVCSIQD